MKSPVFLRGWALIHILRNQWYTSTSASVTVVTHIGKVALSHKSVCLFLGYGWNLRESSEEACRRLHSSEKHFEIVLVVSFHPGSFSIRKLHFENIEGVFRLHTQTIELYSNRFRFVAHSAHQNLLSCCSQNATI